MSFKGVRYSYVIITVQAGISPRLQTLGLCRGAAVKFGYNDRIVPLVIMLLPCPELFSMRIAI